MPFSDMQNARDENNRAADEAVIKSMQNGLELLKAVQDNPSFKKRLLDSAFNAAYQPPAHQATL